MSPIASAPRAPYALSAVTFPFPQLAAACGRSALGGPREIALACFIVGRLAADATSPPGLPQDQRRSRVQGAKQWLASAAIPPTVRAALSRLADSTASEDRGAVKAALESVMTVTASNLESAARLELARLAQAIVE